MKSLSLLLALGASMSGCMTYDEGRVGHLGQSVYATNYEQIADKERAANPGSAPSAAGTDGPLTEHVLKGYRGKTSDAEQVARPIEINID
jgi:hypothetical protein